MSNPGSIGPSMPHIADRVGVEPETPPVAAGQVGSVAPAGARDAPPIQGGARPGQLPESGLRPGLQPADAGLLAGLNDNDEDDGALLPMGRSMSNLADVIGQSQPAPARAAAGRAAPPAAAREPERVQEAAGELQKSGKWTLAAKIFSAVAAVVGLGLAIASGGTLPIAIAFVGALIAVADATGALKWGLDKAGVSEKNQQRFLIFVGLAQIATGGLMAAGVIGLAPGSFASLGKAAESIVSNVTPVVSSTGVSLAATAIGANVGIGIEVMGLGSALSGIARALEARQTRDREALERAADGDEAAQQARRAQDEAAALAGLSPAERRELEAEEAAMRARYGKAGDAAPDTKAIDEGGGANAAYASLTPKGQSESLEGSRDGLPPLRDH